MPRYFTHAGLVSPPIRTSAPDRSTGLRHRTALDHRPGTIDAAHMATANRAAHLRRNPDLVRETYAGCDRAPYGWENANG